MYRKLLSVVFTVSALLSLVGCAHKHNHGEDANSVVEDQGKKRSQQLEISEKKSMLFKAETEDQVSNSIEGLWELEGTQKTDEVEIQHRYSFDGREVMITAQCTSLKDGQVIYAETASKVEVAGDTIMILGNGGKSVTDTTTVGGTTCSVEAAPAEISFEISGREMTLKTKTGDQKLKKIADLPKKEESKNDKK